MFIFGIIRFILSVYTLVLIVNFLLPFCTDTQKPWMAKLTKVCEPALKVGRNVAAKVLPNRNYNIDMGALMAVVVCFILSMILGWLF